MAKMCQSCEMPLKQNPAGGGSNSDGRKSVEFCSHCYADGVFLAPDITMSEMQEVGIKAMKAKGLPRRIGWLLTRNIPHLSRWKTNR